MRKSYRILGTGGTPVLRERICLQSHNSQIGWDKITVQLSRGNAVAQ